MYYQQYPQYPQYQMPQAAQQPQQQQQGIIWVQGESGAKSYLVAPGSTRAERSAYGFGKIGILHKINRYIGYALTFADF